MKWRGLLTGLLIAIATIGGCVYFLKYSNRNQALSVLEENPNLLSLCLLYGDMSDSKVDSKQGMAALGNMIRIRFDAKSMEDCKNSALEYCKGGLAKGFIPGTLGIVMQKKSKDAASVRVNVSRECVIEEPEK